MWMWESGCRKVLSGLLRLLRRAFCSLQGRGGRRSEMLRGWRGDCGCWLCGCWPFWRGLLRMEEEGLVFLSESISAA